MGNFTKAKRKCSYCMEINSGIQEGVNGVSKNICFNCLKNMERCGWCGNLCAQITQIECDKGDVYLVCDDCKERSDKEGCLQC